jgi:hypothetical protein
LSKQSGNTRGSSSIPAAWASPGMRRMPITAHVTATPLPNMPFSTPKRGDGSSSGLSTICGTPRGGCGKRDSCPNMIDPVCSGSGRIFPYSC